MTLKTENINPEIEMLARMWIECDPNRGGSGMGPDEIERIDGEDGGYPRWHWFIPRAKASAEYLIKQGYLLRKE